MNPYYYIPNRLVIITSARPVWLLPILIVYKRSCRFTVDTKYLSTKNFKSTKRSSRHWRRTLWEDLMRCFCSIDGLVCKEVSSDRKVTSWTHRMKRNGTESSYTLYSVPCSSVTFSSKAFAKTWNLVAVTSNITSLHALVMCSLLIRFA